MTQSNTWSLSPPDETNWFLKYLQDKGRRRIINDPVNGRPYMYRHHIFNNKNENDEQTRFNIFIHRMVQSDTRHLHDHPWNYITVILKGGYWEHTPKGVFWRSPGYIGFRRAKSLHYLRLDTKVVNGEIMEVPCTTLFIRFKPKRPWGFIVNNRWVDSKIYHNAKLYLED